MTLTISKDDIGKIMRDLVEYSEDCDHHYAFDCAFCRAKRIVSAYEQDELRLKENEYDSQISDNGTAPEMRNLQSNAGSKEKSWGRLGADRCLDLE